jgi:hypothetical protein
MQQSTKVELVINLKTAKARDQHPAPAGWPRRRRDRIRINCCGA